MVMSSVDSLDGLLSQLRALSEQAQGLKNNTTNSKMEFADGIQKWKEFLGSRRQHNKTSHWRC